MIATRVEIAPGANPAAAPSTFTWTDAGKRRAKVDMGYTAGRDDEATQTEAGSFSATFDDRDGNLSPRNVLGQWYGSLAKGNPVRLLYDRVADPFTRTGSGSFGTTEDGFEWVNKSHGEYLSTTGTRGQIVNTGTNTASIELLDGVGSPDVEVVFSSVPSALTTTSNYRSGAVLRYTDNSNYIRAMVEFTPAGTITLWCQRVYLGSTVEVFGHTDTGLTYEANNTLIAKVRADGPYVMMKVWHIGNDEPDSWMAVGTDRALDSAGVGLIQWKANSDATYTAYVDNFEVTNILWQGSVPEWPKRWPDKSGVDAITPISAAGILRRLAQPRTAPVASPLLRQLSGENPAGYFPLEDASGATSASSAVSGLAAATVTDVTFQSEDTLPGAAGVAVLNTVGTSKITGRIKPINTSDGYAALWFFKMDTLPAGDVQMMEINCTGTVTRWVVGVNATAWTWKGYDRDNTLVVDNSALLGTVQAGKWVAFQLETNVSGGTVNAALIVHVVGSGAFGASSASYSGTATRTDRFTLTPVTASMAVGHLWFGDNDLPFVDGTFANVAYGWTGEAAADRIIRLCGEAGVPVYVLLGDTEPMGRQKSGKLVDLLRECEAADQGILYERGLALAYIPRMRRYNIPVSMALEWKGTFSEPPEPLDDDQRLRNSWTVSRTDGGSATVTDEDSVELNGLWDDSTTINIETDARLVDFAGWFVSMGTADYLRWPRVTIDLFAHPELIGAWLACRVGSRITVANPPSQIAGEVIDLVIEGINATIGLTKWELELACSPAAPWQIGTFDSTGRLYDVDSVTQIDLSPNDEWCPVITADQLGFWSWKDAPYPILAAGQHNIVMGMSRPNSIAIADGTFEVGVDSSWYWTSGSTVDLVTNDSVYGSNCAMLTVGGSPSFSGVRNSYRVGVEPGQTVQAVAWVKCSTARDVVLNVDFWTAYSGGSGVSSLAGTVSVAANTWTEVTVTGVVPATATHLEYGPTLLSSPANGTTLKFVNIDIARTDELNNRQLATLIRATDGFSKAMPAGSAFRVATPARYGL